MCGNVLDHFIHPLSFRDAPWRRPGIRWAARIAVGWIPGSLRFASRPGMTRGSSRRGGFLFIAEFAAQDLADIGLGQVGAEFDLLRDLVVGELRCAELDDVLGGEVRV